MSKKLDYFIEKFYLKIKSFSKYKINLEKDELKNFIYHLINKV